MQLRLCRKHLLRCVSVPLLVLVVACTAKDSARQNADPCILVSEHQKFLVGDPDCLRKFPQKRMAGLWELGYEHSVFYENAAFLPKPSDEDVWLEAEPYARWKAYGVNFDGKTHIYRIEFIGTNPDVPGFYGHAGMYKRGALLLKIIQATELR